MIANSRLVCSMIHSRRWVVPGLLLAWLALPPADALVFIGSDGVQHNVTAPSGALAGSGWQWQGSWGGPLGTPIAAGFFITAAHVGGAVGQNFNFAGSNYVAIASYLAPNADLRLWQIAGQFPNYAPYYTGTTEVNRGTVLVGRGAARGEPVKVGTKTKGWLWGTSDAVTRWGTNTVTGIIDATGRSVFRNSAEAGDMLRFTFDANAGTDEVMLSAGDSGGGVFMKDGGQWKLVAISRSAESNYRFTADGTTFSAALYDRGGLFIQTATGWTLLPENAVEQPSNCFATRIAGSAAWIASVLAATVPPENQVAVESAPSPDGPFAVDPTAKLDAAVGQYEFPRTSGARFYRLRSSQPIPIHALNVSDAVVRLQFGPATP